MKRLLVVWAVAAALISVAAPAARHADAAPGVSDLIAFSSMRSGNLDIWVMHPNGSGVADIAPNPASDRSPAFSPDGSQIAFVSSRDQTASVAGDVYVMSVDGLSVRRVTHDQTKMLQLAWSPDGTKLAYTALSSGNYDIFTINTDGTGETNLTNSPAATDQEPAWSPDGTKIAFTSSSQATGTHIYTMTTAGTFVTQITGDNTSGPAWSPDGSRLAYRSTSGSLWTADADGLKPFKVYDAHAPFLNMAPAWSPDGSSIAFTDVSGISAVHPDGMAYAKLTSGSPDYAPNWQPPQCTVTSVSSGDTFECAGGRKVRMLQIDAPDPGTCGGDWATAAMRYIFLTPGRTVGLKYDTATTDADGRELAAPIWRGNDGMEYNLSIVMAYVGLAKAAIVGAVGQNRDTQQRNTLFLSWAQSSEAYAKAQQWNMWAPGKPFNGGC